MLFPRIYSDAKLLSQVLPYAIAEIDSLYESSSGQLLIDLLILAEDHRNKYHIGVDVIAVARALYRQTFEFNGKGVNDYGGTTIQPVNSGTLFPLSL